MEIHVATAVFQVETQVIPFVTFEKPRYLQRSPKQPKGHVLTRFSQERSPCRIGNTRYEFPGQHMGVSKIGVPQIGW